MTTQQINLDDLTIQQLKDFIVDQQIVLNITEMNCKLALQVLTGKVQKQQQPQMAQVTLPIKNTDQVDYSLSLNK